MKYGLCTTNLWLSEICFHYNENPMGCLFGKWDWGILRRNNDNLPISILHVCAISPEIETMSFKELRPWKGFFFKFNPPVLDIYCCHLMWKDQPSTNTPVFKKRFILNFPLSIKTASGVRIMSYSRTGNEELRT